MNVLFPRLLHLLEGHRLAGLEVSSQRLEAVNAVSDSRHLAARVDMREEERREQVKKEKSFAMLVINTRKFTKYIVVGMRELESSR